ncbi:hypothetical protein [Microbacterium murale]|uniref:Uncharacterized protein n=1 Tax=Microbacterium murale TaxID=1081040 RepID=A0ABQ1RJY0_9MICO|nr:hypothetical protein [Microbacterium murale]GGD69447.1 hypothetical protein GCM10007269_10720 [Microbacterium murale]
MPDATEKERSDFKAAIADLSTFSTAGQRPGGPNFGVAVAVLLHRTDPSRFMIPPVGDATTTSDLQLKVCDPTWAKAPDFLPESATGPIYKPFTTSFKGLSPAVNNWRNSFDIQGGIGCNAPLDPAYLQSAEYVTEHRFDCAFREVHTGLCGAAGADALCFNPDKRGTGLPSWSETRARPRPKLLRRGKDSNGTVGYWSIEPTSSSLADLLGDPTIRVPAASFATALFAGSPYWSRWGNDYSASRLQNLLALDDERFFTLFEGASSTTVSTDTGTEIQPQPQEDRQQGVHELPSQPSTNGVKSGRSALGKSVDYVEADTSIVIERASYESDPERRRQLLEKATRGHRRVLNALAGSLRSCGFSVDEQPGGYDLHAFDGASRHLLFEAKTWTSSNLAAQVRSGWAQLEEYAFRNREITGEAPELVLAFDHAPPTDFWAWDWFASRKSPYVVWVDGTDLVTFDHHADWLAGLLVNESAPK